MSFTTVNDPGSDAAPPTVASENTNKPIYKSYKYYSSQS